MSPTSEEPAPELPSSQVPPSDEGRARRRAGHPNAVRRIGWALGLVLVAAAGVTAWSLPPVHTVLLQSFTRQPSPFTEFYFTSAPTFDGSTVVVPLSLNDHGSGANLYRIRVTLDSPSGKVVARTTVDLKPHDGSPVPVVARLRTDADVAMLRVALLGHPQTLHFSFGNAQVAGPEGTA